LEESEGFENASVVDWSISDKDEHHHFNVLQDTSLQESCEEDVESVV